jgi:hypothetical protein
VNVRGEVHAYLVPEDYRRLRLQALARGVSLSRCAGDCLAEYFAPRLVPLFVGRPDPALHRPPVDLPAVIGR